MTEQEIFDKVLFALREQGVPSFDPDTDTCLYRSPNGLKCAIGHLITDEEYTPNMEGKGVKSLKAFEMLPERLLPHMEMLEDLQLAHDFWDTHRYDWWEHEMEIIANAYSLTYTPTD